MKNKQDYITPLTANTLSDLFYERVKRSKNKIAYRYYDKSWKQLSWLDIEKKVAHWHNAFRHEGLVKGDRVAIMMCNSPDWVVFDQAAYSLGLVVVPIYTNDRVKNIRYILDDANVKIFFIEDPSFFKNLLSNIEDKIELKDLIRIVTKKTVENNKYPRLVQINSWLSSSVETIDRVALEPDSLATIVYTSGGK